MIKNITKSIETEKGKKSKEDLVTEIEDTEKEIVPFVKLGLIEKFDGKSIKTTIRKSNSDEQLNYISNIITPFLESTNARLKALDKVQYTLNLFINSINDYFANKRLSFTLNKGFSIKYQNGEPINFSWLSSGEKQLLLLFINTITATDKATIFIIDEPEISLNIKWQRRLINTLLEFSKGKNIQYLLATHSVELLATNLKSVTKLVQK